MKKVVLILILISVNLTIYSQKMTAYEKKKEELSVQFYKKLGVKQEQIERANDLTDYERLIIFFGLLEKLKTTKGLKILEEYESELREAEKLKNSTDLIRENERKFAEKRIRDSIRNLQIERERIARVNSSDSVILDNKVKSRFDGWLEKNEFEKNVDYLQRLAKGSKQEFDKICYEEVIERINFWKSEDSFIDYEIDNYNSETEKFSVFFRIRDLKWSDSISISIKEALEFKENFLNYRAVIKNSDWCFYQKYLYPTMFFLENQDYDLSLKFNVPIKEKEDIKFAIRKFGIKNFGLDSTYIFLFSENVFKIEEIAKRQEEYDQQRRESSSKIKVTRGDRKILRYSPLNSILNKATIYAKVIVSPDGKGRLVSIVKGSSSLDESYKSVITEFLENTYFDKSDHESMIIIQFNF